MDKTDTLVKEDNVVFKNLLPTKNTASNKKARLVGMLAFAQYSLYKHQYIEQCEKEQGKAPSEEDIKSVITPFRDKNNEQLQDLKQKVELLLDEYAQTYAEKIKYEELEVPIEKVIKKHTNFWSAVRASIFASFLYSLLIALVIFIATVNMPESKFSKVVNILLENNIEPDN